jgi:uncharacterized protein
MNKPEPKPTQSLEEILASIRRALAEEEVQGEADGSASVEPAQAVDQRQSTPAKSDSLPGQLAVALNGSSSGETFADDDLADLLAPVPSKPVPSKEPSAAVEGEAPSAPAGGEQKDPLWFLARQPGPASEPAQPVPDEETLKPPQEQSTATPREEEEAALTRLETLRSSLPPLFGGGEGPAAEAEPVKAAQPAPVPKPAKVAEAAPPEKAKDEKPEVNAPPPEKVPAPQAAPPGPAAAAATPTPAGGVPHPPDPAAKPAVETMAATLEESRRRTLKESPPAVAAQARALEGMIGQLLEPVIRNWLETNLPRLVEKVVREEVARVTADKPDVIDT